MEQTITNQKTSNQKVDQTFIFTTFKSRKLIRSTKATELIMDKCSKVQLIVSNIQMPSILSLLPLKKKTYTVQNKQQYMR